MRKKNRTRNCIVYQILWPIHFLSFHFWFLLYWFLTPAIQLILLNFVTKSQQQGNITHTTTTTLSQARYRLAATSSGELVFFGGGYNSTQHASDRVDIYNVTSGIWTTATLSIPRYYLAATSSQNLVFFGGGWNNYCNCYSSENSTCPSGSQCFGSPNCTCCQGCPSNQVDIYNTSNGRWSTATLSQPRCCLAATSVGNLVLFGGGSSSIVDIHDVTSNTWATTTLSQARSYLAATSIDNRYALFGGGLSGSAPSNVVDIFDSLTRKWSTIILFQNRGYFAATSLGNLAFFGGGYDGKQPSNVVDIFNSTSQTWIITTLSQARYHLATASIGEIVAFGGGLDGSTSSSVVDMLNVTRNTWFTVTLSQPRYWLASTSSTNKIFFGGGYNSTSGPSNVVDIFEIPLSPSTPISISSSVSFPSTLSGTNTSLWNLNSPTDQQSNKLSDSLLQAILGVCSGMILLLIAIIILLILLLIKKKKKNQKVIDKIDKESKIEHKKSFANENQTTVVDIFGETVIKSPMSTYYPDFGTETFKRLSPGQIPLNELEIGSEIGSGTYGRVCVGKWKKYRVALKFCQNRGKIDEFMREANLMISLPPHPNVVQMFGVCLEGTQPIIVMEYCSGGSLNKVLYDKRQHISDDQKIRWIFEIAAGMCHLHKHNIVHRDLASRNILLTQASGNGTPKISDFGMSRILQDQEGKTLNRIGPTRWMAPESLKNQVYSKKTDVWMFGILVYEIVSRTEPHETENEIVVSTNIRDHSLTPAIPANCPQNLRKIMEACWNEQPENRPTFETICQMLTQSKHSTFGQHTFVPKK